MKNLERFIKAQERDYDIALKEIINGKKETHWMWYIFPQIIGLGNSAMSEFYAIKDLEEAREYLNDDILGKRLVEISTELLKLDTNNPVEIFGYIDSLKLNSCMTLFDYISDNEIFSKVINKYFNGDKDLSTIDICDGLSKRVVNKK